MKNLAKLFFSFSLPFCYFTGSALAQGEITVDYKNGETEVFYDVEIFDTKETIYFQVGNNDDENDQQETNETQNGRILMITKNKCDQEGELLVCNKARVGLQSYGVLEELNVEQIFLFINPSDEKQTINGTTVTMSPNTILLEFATEKGGFVNGFGTIDSTTRPTEAMK